MSDKFLIVDSTLYIYNIDINQLGIDIEYMNDSSYRIIIFESTQFLFHQHVHNIKEIVMNGCNIENIILNFGDQPDLINIVLSMTKIEYALILSRYSIHTIGNSYVHNIIVDEDNYCELNGNISYVLTHIKLSNSAFIIKNALTGEKEVIYFFDTDQSNLNNLKNVLPYVV